MKKRIALIVGALLIMTALLASCSQPAATKKSPRWENNESFTFKITLSDFADDDKTLFKNYGKTIKETNEDGTVTEKKITCYKDDVINNSEWTVMERADQIRPVDVNGTYTLDIKENTATTWKVETHQVIYNQYETAKLQELGCLELFSDSELNVTNKEENPFENNSGSITLRSETVSSVIFSNDEDQAPISSVTENKGYYIGKIAQTESSYKYETEYDIANKKASVKKDGGEAEERALNIGGTVKCIDAGQLLLYIRSLDKSSEAFQDTPSVAVYDVTTDSISTVAFGINRQFNLKIDNADLTETIVTVHSVSAAVGGIPLIAQYSLPDVSAVKDANGQDAGYDFLPMSGAKRPKYTTVKFRSGWYSYEIQPDENFRQILDTISIKNVQ